MKRQQPHGLTGQPSNNRRAGEPSTSRIVTPVTQREKARVVKTASAAGDDNVADLVRRLLKEEAGRCGVPE